MSVILRAWIKYGRKHSKLSTWVSLESEGGAGEGEMEGRQKEGGKRLH